MYILCLEKHEYYEVTFIHIKDHKCIQHEHSVTTTTTTTAK